MKYISCIRKFFVNKMRQLVNRIKAIGVDKNISIISNDCVGGIVCHDLKMRFLSPTVNLYFETAKDYLEYLSDIKYYSAQKPTEIHRDGKKYPIGKITNGDKSIVLHFMHYHTFEEAVEKWKERGQRINYDKIAVIWHVPKATGPSYEDFNRFLSFNFDRALIITGDECNMQSKLLINLSLYGKADYYPGKILDYKGPFSAFRFLDKTHYWKMLRGKM